MNELKIFSTYRRRVFLILVILAFLPLLAAVTISLTVTRDLHIQQTINQLETLSELKTNQVRARITQGQAAVRLAAILINTHWSFHLHKPVSGEEMRELKQNEILRDIEPLANSHPFVKSISILNPVTGRVEYSTDPSLRGRFRSQEIYFKIGREKIFVSPLTYSVGREKDIMHISGPVRDKHHKLLSVVAAEMDLSDLNTIFKKNTGLGETGRTYLVDSFGFYVAESAGESRGVLRKIAQSEGVRRMLAKEKGYGFYDNEKGLRVLGVYRWLEFSNMGLLIEIENSELLEPIRRVWTLIIILGACLLGLVILAANRVSIWLVSPIKKMALTAGALQEGDYSVRARLKGPDEARFLAAAFNSMAENIQASHENLERLVAERTGELERSNERLKREITERKMAEEELREREERYRTILENMEEGYYEVDLAGNFTFFNDAMCKIRGISRDDLMGMNNRDYMAPETAEEVYEAFNRVYTTGEPDKNLVWVTIRPDGTQSYLETSASLIKDSRDEPTGFRGIVRDVTERKQSDEKQTALKAQLQQAQKMESIGTLAGGIAHDFNNILLAIRGFTEIALKYELPEEAPARHSLGQVIIASDRARDLVQQILTFSRIKEHEVLPVNVSPIIKEALKLLRATLPATIEIRQEIIAVSDTILGDPTQIHQVLMNLCTNAYQSMPDEKGVLTVSLVDLHLDSEGAGHYSDIEPGQHLELAVSDTGQGIEPDNIDRIFEPYFTTKTVSEGTGLGLAVVHGIVKSLGGDITVASELGKGSVFQVILPVIKQTNLMEKETLEHLLKGNEHILFIDDERFIVEMGTTMLEALGYKVSAYMNPLEALTAFRASPKEFDLVITDMTMPEMTGDILAEKILDIQPGLPVIICTGYSNLMSPDRARSIGIRELVEKPYTSEEIALAVRRLLDTD